MKYTLRGLGRRRLLRLMRAARALRESSDPFANYSLAVDIEHTSLGLPSDALSDLDRVGLKTAALCTLRQRLVATLIVKKLMPALMLHLHERRPIAAGMPPTWQRRLIERGITLNRSASSWAWRRTLVLFYLHALRTAVQLVYGTLSAKLSPAPTGPYTVLVNLQANNLPPSTLGRRMDWDLVTWYRRTRLHDPSEQIWAHLPGSRPHARSANVHVVAFPMARLPGRRALWSYVGRLPRLFARALVQAVRGRWWEVVLMEQRVQLEYAMGASAKAFARAYVFNNAYFVLRPLWTYWAERQGATVDLVFYSTNIELFRHTGGAGPEHYGYRGMTWSSYVVWDEYQAELLRRLGHHTDRTSIAGVVGFTDAATALAPLPEGYVVVFDVTPQRPASLARRGMPQPYYRPEIWKRFMDDIQAVLADAGLAMVYKKKREIGRTSAAGFRARLSSASHRARIISVDPDVAPHHLISGGAAVISMPFTSTALVARAMGKPSVFYDPLGVLTTDRRLAHGIPVLGSTADLTAWLASCVVGATRGETGLKATC